MFINLTNHPFTAWSEEQLAAAASFGDIRDMPFPQVDAHADSAQIRALAEKLAAEIIALQPAAVLCQGEMTLCFALVERLSGAGVTVLCATSERITDEHVDANGNTVRSSVFKFVRFREFC